MDPASFREYLSENGLNDATINKLLEEDIDNVSTLQILTEDDIEGLGLKMGQKARLRTLSTKQPGMTRQETDGSQRYKEPVTNMESGPQSGKPKPQARKRTTLDDSGGYTFVGF